MSISKALSLFIQQRVDDIFDDMKATFLPSMASKTKRMSFGAYSLGSLYENSARALGGKPSEKTLAGLSDVANVYLEGEKEKLKAALLAEVTAEARNDEMGQESEEKLRERLVAAVERAEAGVKRIVDVEANRAKTVGYTEGVIQSATSLGDEDPTVAWLCVHDDRLCDLCKRLHLMPDGLTPRSWKLSQCTHEYGNKDSLKPSLAGLHPHDRCILVYVPRKWGFHNGNLTFIGGDYDLYRDQQGL